MRNQTVASVILYILLLANSNLSWAVSATWQATSSSELNSGPNWTGGIVPGPASVDTATFSFAQGVNTTPSASTGFTVGQLQFVTDPSIFNLSIESSELELTGLGFTGVGVPINPTINITNNLNSSVLSRQLYLSGSGATTSLGQANITVTNIGSELGNSYLHNEQIRQEGTIAMISDNASITIINSGVNNDTGTIGGKNIAVLNGDDTKGLQYQFENSLVCGNNVSFNLLNQGIDNSANDTDTNYIAWTDDGQWADEPTGSATFGDGVQIVIRNIGINNNTSSTGANHQIGYIWDAQMETRTIIGGNNVSFTISNEGTDNSNNSVGSSVGQVGFTNDPQMNCGADSGRPGSVIIGDNATFTISNSGTNNNTNPALTGAQIGYVPWGHFISCFDDPSYYFQGGNNLTFTLTNTGINNNTSLGGNLIGYLGSSQISFYQSTSFGSGLSMTIENSSSNVIANDTSNKVGYVGDSQLWALSQFSAGDNATISVTNSGTIDKLNSSVGAQIEFDGDFSIGNNSSITAINSGIVNGPQMQIGTSTTAFSVGTASTLTAINTGTIGASLAPGSPKGINIHTSSQGGDVRVVLKNSELNVITSAPQFIIGGITGDGSSSATTNVPLTISTDSGYTASFAGPVGPNNSTLPSAVSLTKNGLGTQTLSGVNTYTGLTTVQQGKLILGASGVIPGAVQVNPEATLAGTGTIGDLVTNNGFVIPGQSIGTLTMGSYIQLVGGTFVTQINRAGQSSQLFMDGTALIDGALEIISLDGTYAINRIYRLITANGGRTGTFQQTIANPLLIPTVTYGPTFVDLLLRTNFAGAALTSNQRNVALQIDQNPDPNADEALVIDNLLALTPAQIPAVLNQLTGFQYTYLAQESQYSDRRFGRRIFNIVRNEIDPCTTTLCCGDFDGWVELEAGKTFAHGDSEAAGARTCSFDVSMGGQTLLDCCNFTFVGFAANYETEKLGFNYPGGSGHAQTGQGALYVGYVDPCGFYLFADVILGYSQFDITRPIYFSEINRHARGRSQTFHGNGYGEIGYDLHCCSCLFQPFFGFDAECFHQFKFKEHNADSLDLRINSHDTINYNTFLGTHMTAEFPLDCKLSADIAWQHRFGSHPSTKTNFVEFGENFNIKGNSPGNDGLWGSINLEAPLCDCGQIYAEFAGEYWKNWSAYSFSAGLLWSW